MAPLGELVSFENKRGLRLDGILYRADESAISVVHVHGSYGNFYQNNFVRLFASRYVTEGLNFLSFNISGHDGIAEGYRGNDFEYVGGAVSPFSECVHDIASAIDLVKRFSSTVVLEGHSLGCDRILHFLLTTGARLNSIFLSPCDSYALHSRWIRPESVEQQIQRLKGSRAGEDLETLPSREYGVRQGGGEVYNIPITRRALLSIIDGPPFKLMRIDTQAEFSLNSSAFAYIGGQDQLQTVGANTMFSHLEMRVRRLRRLYVADGDHDMKGCEDIVAKQIAAWIFEECRS